MGVLNGVYKAAAWRGTTPYHAEVDRMGVCFDLPDGQVIRLAISRESAMHLADSIADYLGRAHGVHVTNERINRAVWAIGGIGSMRAASISERISEEVDDSGRGEGRKFAIKPLGEDFIDEALHEYIESRYFLLRK